MCDNFYVPLQGPSRDCFWITIYFVLGLLAISPPQRPRCVVGREGDWGGGKEKRAEEDMKGKEEKRALFPFYHRF